MSQVNTTAAEQAADLSKQLTKALMRGDMLRRQKAELERDIETNERNVACLQNLVTGIELGKQVAADAAKAAENQGPQE